MHGRRSVAATRREGCDQRRHRAGVEVIAMCDCNRVLGGRHQRGDAAIAPGCNRHLIQGRRPARHSHFARPRDRQGIDRGGCLCGGELRAPRGRCLRSAGRHVRPELQLHLAPRRHRALRARSRHRHRGGPHPCCLPVHRGKERAPVIEPPERRKRRCLHVLRRLELMVQRRDTDLRHAVADVLTP